MVWDWFQTRPLLEWIFKYNALTVSLTRSPRLYAVCACRPFLVTFYSTFSTCQTTCFGSLANRLSVQGSWVVWLSRADSR